MATQLKKGDKVIIIAGQDKGKTGAIQKIDRVNQRVVVEGINVRKKHQKPKQNNPEGSIIDIYAPIHLSNVALIDPKSKKATRFKVSVVKDKKVRLAVKSGATIE
ncbi:MAG: 50S ribosomal protein L24 [Bacilli bacterium]